MAKKTIKIESKKHWSEKEIMSQVPEGYCLLNYRTSPGEQKSVQVVASTLEAAFDNAYANIPSSAIILEKRILRQLGAKVIRFRTFDEQDPNYVAEQQVLLHKGTGIRELKLISQGSKGFFGLGKKPSEFEVTIELQAIVEIDFQTLHELEAEIIEVNETAVEQLIEALDRRPFFRESVFTSLLKFGESAINILIEIVCSDCSYSLKSSAISCIENWDTSIVANVVDVLLRKMSNGDFHDATERMFDGYTDEQETDPIIRTFSHKILVAGLIHAADLTKHDTVEIIKKELLLSPCWDIRKVATKEVCSWIESARNQRNIDTSRAFELLELSSGDINREVRDYAKERLHAFKSDV